ncbi:MAG TPA: OmpH family outer membrane protein [Cyclobacteriaceae bacterium]|nr:OmpH family outer membrane protein [Cyclobacteriaceae bacterium]
MLKRIITILCVVAIPFSMIRAQDKALKIGYTNLDYILSQLPEYKEIESEISNYQKQLQAQLASKYQEFQAQVDDYQTKAQSGNMTPDDMKKREQELTEMRDSINKFQGDADSSIQKKSADLLQPAYDKILKAIQEFSVENGYTYILSNSAGAMPILLYADEKSDVTDGVLRKLGIEPSTEK